LILSSGKRGPFAGINPSWQRITNGIKYRKSLGDFAVALSPPIEMIAVEKKNPLLYFNAKAQTFFKNILENRLKMIMATILM
jgi:hypothetical protein